MSFGRIASAAAAVAAGSFGSMYYAASKPNKDAEPSLGFRSQSIGEAYLSSLQTGTAAEKSTLFAYLSLYLCLTEYPMTKTNVFLLTLLFITAFFL